MQLELTIADIGRKLREDRFPNEQSISQGIVLRILSDLGWDVYDTNVVWPEFSTGEGRVDFALCSPPEKPKCFVEVKQPGKAEDGVKQALEYAFHTGAQFVTLTDGQTWSFYLPAEQGSYEDRRVFKLDLYERTDQESAEILQHYLERERLASGKALETARKEYRNKHRRSAARQEIPTAWNEIVERGDEQLVELLTNAVESKVGIRPVEKDVLKFLTGLALAEPVALPTTPPSPDSPKPNHVKPAAGTITGRIWDIAAEITASKQRPALREEVLDAATSEGIKQSTASTQYGRWARSVGLTGAELAKIRRATGTRLPPKITKPGAMRTGTGVLRGKQFSYGTAKEAMVFILGELAKSDSTFLVRCSQHSAFRGRKRRYIAKRAADLYPDRPDLMESHEALPGGWVVGTNLNNQSKMRIIRGAAEVAGITYGRDVVVDF